MPLAKDPVASVSETAASFAEIKSSARNKSATLYARPAIKPTTLGTTSVAFLLVMIMAFGLSSGMRVTAVSTFSVLAGPYSPCGSLAASTWPVSALATTHADAGTLGSGGPEPAGSSTTIPLLAISVPPTTCAAGLPGGGIDGNGRDGRLSRPAVVAFGARPDGPASTAAATELAAAAATTAVTSQDFRRTPDLPDRSRPRGPMSTGRSWPGCGLPTPEPDFAQAWVSF